MRTNVINESHAKPRDMIKHMYMHIHTHKLWNAMELPEVNILGDKQQNTENCQGTSTLLHDTGRQMSQSRRMCTSRTES